MFRVVVSVGLALIFSLISFLVYDTVGGNLRGEVEQRLTERLTSAHRGLSQLQHLAHSATRARAEKVASSNALIDLLSSKVSSDLDYVERHNQAMLLLGVEQDRFENQGKSKSNDLGRLEDWNVGKPYAFQLVDAEGQLIADVNNPRRFAVNVEGTKDTSILKKYPTLQTALSGESFYDIWKDIQPLIIGVAPVMKNGRVLGAIILGEHINQNAQSYKRTLLADVGFFFHNSVHGSSTLDGREEKDLEELSSQLIKAYQEQPNEPIHIRLGEKSVLIRLGTIAGQKSKGEMYFFIATHWEGPIETALAVRGLTTLYLMLGLLMSLILYWVSYHYFINPLRDIEEGVIKVTNGDLNYWFTYDVGAVDLSPTLCQHLDVMVSQLSGRDMPEISNQDSDS